VKTRATPPIAPIDLPCPACGAAVGDLCRPILSNGTGHPTECVDFHHASRVDAALREVWRRLSTPVMYTRPAGPAEHLAASYVAAPYEFRECAACAAKPGAPELCPACLHNRKIVDRLRESLRAALKMLDRARSAGVGPHDALTVDAWRKELDL